jgi:hypothetical protein
MVLYGNLWVTPVYKGELKAIRRQTAKRAREAKKAKAEEARLKQLENEKRVEEDLKRFERPMTELELQQLRKAGFCKLVSWVLENIWCKKCPEGVDGRARGLWELATRDRLRFLKKFGLTLLKLELRNEDRARRGSWRTWRDY